MVIWWKIWLRVESVIHMYVCVGFFFFFLGEGEGSAYERFIVNGIWMQICLLLAMLLLAYFVLKLLFLSLSIIVVHFISGLASVLGLFYTVCLPLQKEVFDEKYCWLMDHLHAELQWPSYFGGVCNMRNFTLPILDSLVASWIIYV